MAEEYRCSNCGAPLDVSPETIAIVCSYCGFLNWVREDLKEEVLVVKPIEEGQALKRLADFATKKGLGEVFRQSNLSKAAVVAIPFYFVDVSAEANYSGRVAVRVRKCRREKDSERCWIDTHNIYVRGVYGPYSGTVPVVARRGSDVVSVKALANRYMASRVEAVPIGKVELDRNVWSSILSIEIDRKTAMDIALDTHLDSMREMVENVIRREAENRVRMRGENVVGSTVIWKRITPINVKMVSSKPILLPMYIAVYRYGNDMYRSILCGWDGEAIVLERPMKRLERVAWGSLAAIASGVLGGLGVAAIGIWIGIGLIAIGSIASWYCMRKALMPVKSSIFSSGVLVGSVKSKRYSRLLS
ncbi:MAG: zinc ribbon domain-containing protein [Ignisphaera sp.]|uniref:Zinc ribbon domain-containing protein n=1 Tax=Ignisphaera aggregans TaxID=334771 RepID=A0A7J3JS15_9CREN